jgi:hypothetical protein
MEAFLSEQGHGFTAMIIFTVTWTITSTSAKAITDRIQLAGNILRNIDRSFTDRLCTTRTVMKPLMSIDSLTREH